MLSLFLGDDEGPRPVSARKSGRMTCALAIPRAITFLALLIPFATFAFVMTAMFGAGADRQ